MPAVEGIDMATGAQEGFFAPKRILFGGKHANFLTAENLDRPEFGLKTARKKRTVDGEQKKDTMWKVRALVDHLNKNCKDMWVPGMFLAIDEQTIGFQGMSGMKL